jgi:multiple antibiotic resistance protein
LVIAASNILSDFGFLVSGFPMHTFFQVFIPLFVALDVVGLIPIFLAVTGDLDDRQRRRVSFEAVASALLICLGFMFVGNPLFALLGVRQEHFMIAGGVLLLVLSVLDIVIIGKPAMAPAEVVGVVPLGMPLIAGPATLSTVLLLVLSVLDIVIIGKPAMAPAEVVGVVPLGMPLIAGPATLSTVLLLAGNKSFGYAWTALSISVNLAIVLVGLLLASRLGRVLGLNALRAMSKVVMILLAALAIRFIAEGVQTIIRHGAEPTAPPAADARLSNRPAPAIIAPHG